MPHRLGLLLALVLVLIAGSASAQPAKLSAYDACMSKAQSTVAMQDCQKAGLAAADARLNAVYRKILALLPADQQEKLRKSERAWIAFRDADCDVYIGKETGTMASIDVGACVIARTGERVVTLGGFMQE